MYDYTYDHILEPIFVEVCYLTKVIKTKLQREKNHLQKEAYDVSQYLLCKTKQSLV